FSRVDEASDVEGSAGDFRPLSGGCLCQTGQPPGQGIQEDGPRSTAERTAKSRYCCKQGVFGLSCLPERGCAPFQKQEGVFQETVVCPAFRCDYDKPCKDGGREDFLFVICSYQSYRAASSLKLGEKLRREPGAVISYQDLPVCRKSQRL